jgi:hypothetical protein
MALPARNDFNVTVVVQFSAVGLKPDLPYYQGVAQWMSNGLLIHWLRGRAAPRSLKLLKKGKNP